MGTTLYLEDFEIGKAYVSKSRTITEADVVNFAGVSGDFNPLHMSDEVGKKSMFGKRIAHGALGFVISNGLENQMGLFDDSLIAFMECAIGQFVIFHFHRLIDGIGQVVQRPHAFIGVG